MTCRPAESSPGARRSRCAPTRRRGSRGIRPFPSSTRHSRGAVWCRPIAASATRGSFRTGVRWKPARPSATSLSQQTRLSRAHHVRFLPRDTIATTDLGLDLVRFWRGDPARGSHDVALARETGPRHSRWHPSEHLFVVTELSNDLYALAHDASGQWRVVAGAWTGRGITSSCATPSSWRVSAPTRSPRSRWMSAPGCRGAPDAAWTPPRPPACSRHPEVAAEGRRVGKPMGLRSQHPAWG